MTNELDVTVQKFINRFQSLGADYKTVIYILHLAEFNSTRGLKFKIQEFLRDLRHGDLAQKYLELHSDLVMYQTKFGGNNWDNFVMKMRETLKGIEDPHDVLVKNFSNTLSIFNGGRFHKLSENGSLWSQGYIDHIKPEVETGGAVFTLGSEYRLGSGMYKTVRPGPLPESVGKVIKTSQVTHDDAGRLVLPVENGFTIRVDPSHLNSERIQPVRSDDFEALAN